MPRSLAAICMKALNEKLIERYQKVGDSMRDVEVHMAGYIPDADTGAGFKRHLSQYIYRNQKVLFCSDFYVCSFDKYYTVFTLFSTINNLEGICEK